MGKQLMARVETGSQAFQNGRRRRRTSVLLEPKSGITKLIWTSGARSAAFCPIEPFNLTFRHGKSCASEPRTT